MENGCVHAAVNNRETEVLNLLLANGASHSAPGKGGFTPLALAAGPPAVAAHSPIVVDSPPPPPLQGPGANRQPPGSLRRLGSTLGDLSYTPIVDNANDSPRY